LLSLTFASQVKSQNTPKGRNAQTAGRPRTLLACALRQSDFATHQPSSQPRRNAQRCARNAKTLLASATLAGQGRGLTLHATIPASALLNWASATRAKSLSTPRAKSAQIAGQRKTLHAIALLPLGFANHLQCSQKPVRALLFVQAAPTHLASAQQAPAGQAPTCRTPQITPASALLSWASARPAKSQSIQRAKNAQVVGRQRTRHAIALLRLDFVTNKDFLLQQM